MEKGRTILKDDQFKLTIDRLCHQLIENHDDFSHSCIIGIQPKGTYLAQRLQTRLLELTGLEKIDLGILDVTFYRDDFRTRLKPLSPSQTKMDFLVEDKNVVLADDVLYSGRTVRAALTALEHYGRANKIELISMVDRHYNRHLPIKSDYTGIKIDALDEAYVSVEWQEVQGSDKVILFPKKLF
jgi:pyrimidine operon attenuation protein/uracil phosphoribosyltransferase